MTSSYKNIEIDNIKLNKMKFKIFSLERENAKNKKYTNQGIVEEIHKIMMEEMNKKI